MLCLFFAISLLSLLLSACIPCTFPFKLATSLFLFAASQSMREEASAASVSAEVFRMKSSSDWRAVRARRRWSSVVVGEVGASTEGLCEVDIAITYYLLEREGRGANAAAAQRVGFESS